LAFQKVLQTEPKHVPPRPDVTRACPLQQAEDRGVIFSSKLGPGAWAQQCSGGSLAEGQPRGVPREGTRIEKQEQQVLRQPPDRSQC
jgi:hypothetical protein